MSIKVVQKEFIKDDMRGRDSSIDLIKGIAILLVMSGHCIGFFQGVTESMKDDLINSFINSFHMPLFFLAGGVLAQAEGCNRSPKAKIPIADYSFNFICDCKWNIDSYHSWYEKY